MSGGYFDYQNYALEDIKEKIERVLNKTQDAGEPERHYPEYNEKTKNILERTVQSLEEIGIYLNRLDYWLSYDDSEDSMHLRLKEDLYSMMADRIEKEVTEQRIKIVNRINKLQGSIEETVNNAINWEMLQGQTLRDRIIIETGKQVLSPFIINRWLRSLPCVVSIPHMNSDIWKIFPGIAIDEYWQLCAEYIYNQYCQ